MITTEIRGSHRLQREKEFHNDAFSDKRREALEKYYSLGEIEYQAYQSFLDERSHGSQFLEYGCGPWGYIYEAAKTAASSTAIDISEVAIEQSREKAKETGVEITFQVMDAENLQFEENSFNLICGSSILHHLDLEKSLKEIDRVLAPGGSAAFMEPLGHNLLINAYRLLTPSLRTSDEHPLTRSDLELIKSYFPGSRFEYFHLITLSTVPFRNTKIFRRLLNAANRLDQYLFSKSPFLASHSWFCNIYLER